MPNPEQMQQLIDNCTFIWTRLKGVEGRIYAGPNGRSFFLPAAGMRETWKSGSYENIWVNRGGCCYYWLAQRDSDNVGQAYSFRLANLELVKSNNGRDKGLSVRPVAR